MTMNDDNVLAVDHVPLTSTTPTRGTRFALPHAAVMLRSRIFPLVVALVVLCAFFSTRSHYFLTATNVLNVGKQIAVVLIVALGITVVLIAGEIDISMAGVMAVCSVTTGAVLQHAGSSGGVSPIVIAVGLCLLIGAVFGVVNGVITVLFRVPSFIVTLGTLSIGGGLALSYNNSEPRAVQATNFLDLFALGKIGPIPVLLVYPIALAVVTVYMLRRTLFGIQVYATGGNSEASRLSGVPVKRVRVAVLVLCSVFAAIAGLVGTARVQSGLPNIAAGIELDAIAAAVLGGTRLSGGVGTVIGTVLGATLIGVVSNGLTLMGVASPTQSVIKGAVIILAVVLDGLRTRRGQ
jgi:ribose transport system permease protein